MKNRAIFLLLILLVFLPLISAAAEPAKRALEIVYPKIPGVETPEYVSTGLPEYVNYIFRFAVIVIGILIFGVLVYSGINYLLSFGNPTKLSDAKQGITAAGLGGLILLGAYLIFNTINPQLLILTPPEIGMLKAYIVPGVYICNYNVKDIGDILSKYTTNIPEFQTDSQARENALKTRTEAAQRLKDAMGKPGPGPICFLANYSGPLTNFVIKAGSTDWTLFMIPSEIKENDWEYNFGIILHENDKFGGRCSFYPHPLYKAGNNAEIYHQVGDYHPKNEFTVKSVTVFRKPYFEPSPEYEGATLYEGLAFNEIGKPKEEGACGNGKCEEGEQQNGKNPCPADWFACGGGGFFRPKEIFFSLLSPFLALAERDTSLAMKNFKPDVLDPEKKLLFDAKYVSQTDLGKLTYNTRSIEIKPRDGYIALLIGGKKNRDKAKEWKCEVRRTDDAKLTDDPIGRCGTGCEIVVLGINRYLLPDSWCSPCLDSMYVIKGQAL